METDRERLEAQKRQIGLPIGFDRIRWKPLKLLGGKTSEGLPIGFDRIRWKHTGTMGLRSFLEKAYRLASIGLDGNPLK